MSFCFVCPCICLSSSMALGILNSGWMNAIRCNMLKTKCQHKALALCCRYFVCLDWLVSVGTWTIEFLSLNGGWLPFPPLSISTLALVFCVNYVYKVYWHQAIVTDSFNRFTWVDDAVFCPFNKEVNYSCGKEITQMFSWFISFSKYLLCGGKMSH